MVKISVKKNRASNNNSSMLDDAIKFQHQRKYDQAAHLYRECLKRTCQDATVWSNFATTLRKLGHFEAAAAAARRSLELRPGYPPYLTNYGNILTDMDKKEEAIKAHAAAVRSKPDSFLYRKNYACALREFREFDAGLEQLNIAHTMQPDNVHILWDRAVTYLHLGRFLEGWQAFEIRQKLPPPEWTPRDSGAPCWRGESLKGKTILIYAEQGFGDTILCSRYIPMVKMRGGSVILECKKPLHRLFGTIPGIDLMVEPNRFDEKLDYQVAMMSLPGIFKTDLASIPPLPELFVPDNPPPEAKKLLDLAGDRLKVGIVWSGSVTFKNNRKRAVSVERFLDFANVPGVQLYSLQKGPCEDDLEKCGGQGLVWELAPHINDFADTAAILKKLDLVIMTDSSVAHLAGSLSVPIWNLLCYQSYWLYLSERQDCPWYPSMRLFRQPEAGDWDSVFTKAKEALEIFAAMKHTDAKTLKVRKQKAA